MLAGRVFLLAVILALSTAEEQSTLMIQPVLARPVQEKKIALLADEVSGIQALGARDGAAAEGETGNEGGEEHPSEGPEIPGEPTENPAPENPTESPENHESTGEAQEGGQTEHPEATGGDLQDVTGSETGHASEESDGTPVTSPIRIDGDSAPALFAAPLVAAYLLL
eukprot:Protomagalhaensia_wolfi_Nauph_80__3672@NODE_3703_length_730_cov_3401_785818_g2917_i0_p1_GENE_NODE_3703_length_730_cov_3401_785818_g2917_i0NODE_3703_length_730_cov_3401_785818_g2917_i0_p1_ORF_typecomplete_len168_score53_80ABC2_membrane_4/PF12730_7/0_14_NODE_3703_length_730_cov_3401_785818_g2917_i0130633